MSPRVAVVLSVFVTILAKSKIARTQGTISTFQIVASKCADDLTHVTYGTAFVVQGFGPFPQSTPVMVTALHVVHDCKSITVERINCNSEVARPYDDGPYETAAWQLDATQSVATWPDLDLAAWSIPVSEHDDRLKILGIDVRTLVKLNFSAEVPTLSETRSKPSYLSIPATSKSNGCPVGVAIALYKTSVAHQTTFIVTRVVPGMAETAVRGSLAPYSQVLTYFGTPDEGTSGAPVVRVDDGEIVAVHQAGYDHRNLGWGIVIPGSALSSKQPDWAVVDNKKPWPTFKAPHFHQSDIEERQDLINDARRWQPSNVIFALDLRAGVLPGQRTVADPISGFFELRLSLFIDILEFPYPSRDNAFGLYLGAARRWASLVETFRGPDGMTLSERRISEQSTLGDALFEVRVGRRKNVQFQIATGVRVGVAAFPDENDQLDHGLAFAIPARFAFSWSPPNNCKWWRFCFSGTVGVDVSYERNPSVTYTYSGIGAANMRSLPYYGPTIQVGVGLEL